MVSCAYKGSREADWMAVVNQECTHMPDPFVPPFLEQTDQTGLLSVGNMTGGPTKNSTDLRLQS